VVDTLFVLPADEVVESDEVNTEKTARLARVTLVGRYLDTASSPHPYDSGYREITIDEHAGHTNMATRLEVFADIVRGDSNG
jgi:hypothetical protein